MSHQDEVKFYTAQLTTLFTVSIKIGL